MTKSPIKVKGRGHISEKPLFFEGVPNKKSIYRPIGLGKAPNDAPSHEDASQSRKLHIEVKAQGHICEEPLFFDGVPNKKFIYRPIDLDG